MKRTLHTIKMVNIEKTEDKTITAIYNNVVDARGLYGCTWELQLSDGGTASFDMDAWEMWDLTPQKGWNSNID